ncbi:Uncharacterised protein [Klebsiella pneumoniae]|nr:Uncharacterised protein [Klebsiella pneumoniae]SWW12259.1 Uncharacterised protein [Klebsiella pneumoniae]
MHHDFFGLMPFNNAILKCLFDNLINLPSGGRGTHCPAKQVHAIKLFQVWNIHQQSTTTAGEVVCQ